MCTRHRARAHHIISCIGERRARCQLWAQPWAKRPICHAKSLITLVGAGRFELPTPCSRSNRAPKKMSNSNARSCGPLPLRSISVHCKVPTKRQPFSPTRELFRNVLATAFADCARGSFLEAWVMVPIGRPQGLRRHAQVPAGLIQIDARLHQPGSSRVPTDVRAITTVGDRRPGAAEFPDRLTSIVDDV